MVLAETSALTTPSDSDLIPLAVVPISAFYFPNFSFFRAPSAAPGKPRALRLPASHQATARVSPDRQKSENRAPCPEQVGAISLRFIMGKSPVSRPKTHRTTADMPAIGQEKAPRQKSQWPSPTDRRHGGQPGWTQTRVHDAWEWIKELSQKRLFKTLGIVKNHPQKMPQTPKKLIERQDLDAFLSRLSRIEDQMPNAILESERPDFIVTFGRESIGIETTRTVHQECVRALKLQASTHPCQWVNLTNLVGGQSRRTNCQLERSFGAAALLQPWKTVEESMQDWKLKVSVALNSKRQKLGRPSYQIFGENWLLIHDFPPLPVDWHTRELVFQHLTDIFAQQPKSTRDFEKIFIHSGDWLFRSCQGNVEFN